MGARDGCPHTPAGVRVLTRGCAAHELLASPAAVTGTASAAVDRSRRDINRVTGLRKPAKGATSSLGDVVRQIRSLNRRIRRNPCAAARTLTATSARSGQTRRALARAVLTRLRTLRSRAPRGLGRGSELPEELIDQQDELRRAQDDAVAATVDVRASAALLRRLCAQVVGTRRITGTVASLEQGIVRLVGGQVVAVNGSIDAGTVPGIRITAEGLRLKDQVLAAEKVDTTPLKPTGLSIECRAALWIAPVQASDVPPEKVFATDAAAYVANGTLRLEEGMGLLFRRSNGCSALQKELFVNVRIRYVDSTGQTRESPGRTTRGVTEDGIGLVISDGIGSPTPVEILIEGVVADCPTPTTCKNHETLFTETRTARVSKRGAWAKARYDRTLFSVEDGSPDDFDTGVLTGVDAPLLPGARAWGYRYSFPVNGIAFKSLEVVEQGGSFPVYDDVPGGLPYAYARGTRDGHEYFYAAELPQIVTDVVTFCPAQRQRSYYRLPWLAPGSEFVAQGNFGSFSHQNTRAFDFVMEDKESIYAPRGGVVTHVEESYEENSDPSKVEMKDAKPSNILEITHQDGTRGKFRHMPKNGVFVSEGQTVRRGDRVGIIGETGYASDPHLHYIVNVPEGQTSKTGVLSLWEVKLNGQILTCHIPQEGSTYESTNIAP